MKHLLRSVRTLAAGAGMRVAVALAWTLVLVAPARAQWPLTSDGAPVCVATDEQTLPVAVESGARGMIVAWQDLRNGADYDVYVQRMQDGTNTWPAAGVPLCTAAYNQLKPAIASDGAGGAIVVWEDYRANGLAGTADLYAQHVLASGVVDPAWPVNGSAVCTAALEQLVPTIVPDGAHGAVIAWQDGRGGYDVYAQHLRANGTLDPAWPATGLPLCSAVDGQGSQVMVSDGAGGAIVAWHDFRNHLNWDIYAQRALASGVVDPAWPVNGRALCTAAGHQTSPAICSDTFGGAIVTWEDRRAGPFDLYAQHVFSSGVVDATWPADGRAVCVAGGDQTAPVILSDGVGGAFIAWPDGRAGAANLDIYAMHLQSSGALDSRWPVDGLALCSAAGTQSAPRLVNDGLGGAIACWQDGRTPLAEDIYGTRFTSSGIVDPSWPANGRAVCTVSGQQLMPTMVSDGERGALIAWKDYRVDVYDYYANLYSGRVCDGGLLGLPARPTIFAVTDVPADQGGHVALSFWPSHYELDGAAGITLLRSTIWRSVPAPLALRAIALGATVDDGALPGVTGPRYRTTRSGALTAYWEFVAEQAAWGDPDYTLVISTLADAPNVEDYIVIAEQWEPVHPPGQLWLSNPASGSSYDNLAPAAPTPMPSQYSSGTAQLHWAANSEPDLAGYRLYRGASPGFDPGAAPPIASTSSTSWTDPAGSALYYKVTAVDVHGNEGSPSALILTIVGVSPEGPPRTLDFSPPGPNPASGSTRFTLAMPVAGRAQVAIFDAAGREVAPLLDGEVPAGSREVVWDLCDTRGRPVCGGLYFARLVASGRTVVRRVAVAR